MDMKVDSSYIKRERERRAWSQEHLAEVTGLGLRTIQRIEKTGCGLVRVRTFAGRHFRCRRGQAARRGRAPGGAAARCPGSAVPRRARGGRHGRCRALCDTELRRPGAGGRQHDHRETGDELDGRDRPRDRRVENAVHRRRRHAGAQRQRPPSQGVPVFDRAACAGRRPNPPRDRRLRASRQRGDSPRPAALDRAQWRGSRGRHRYGRRSLVALVDQSASQSATIPPRCTRDNSCGGADHWPSSSPASPRPVRIASCRRGSNRQISTKPAACASKLGSTASSRFALRPRPQCRRTAPPRQP